MYVIKVEDKYYVAKVFIGTDDSYTADVAISEDIDDALIFNGADGWHVMKFLKSCDGDTDFQYVKVEYDG